VNPRIGSRAKQTCTVVKEETAEVVRNHEGGSQAGGSSFIGSAETWCRKADFAAWDDGGAVFGKPQERRFGLIAESHGSGRDGKAGVKVRRVERTYPFRQ